ncbi:A24 family peptidase [Maricaulis sp.]|jgi:prepilin signal peptidase PulO-like enzyme (type II secretory pathway)|uniref:prepilin peptidase n=1 Tax=Maricaulis sp. TaxID=1486257 RepID=UPI00261D3521|nr:A24 family peptidase [Maricaulis sp.]
MIVIHAASLILIGALIALAWIDFRTYRLPDPVTLPLIAAGIALNTFALGTPWVSIVGAAAGYAAFVGIEVAFKRLRGIDGLGRGDAKLIAAGGAWCGGWLLPAMVLVGAVSALVFVGVVAAIRKRQPDELEAYAFGPWLALGIACGWIYRAYGPGLYPAF